MTFWSDHRGIIYGVRTIRVYELIQDLPYFSCKCMISTIFIWGGPIHTGYYMAKVCL